MRSVHSHGGIYFSVAETIDRSDCGANHLSAELANHDGATNVCQASAEERMALAVGESKSPEKPQSCINCIKTFSAAQGGLHHPNECRCR